jgi:hypothetical protein
MWCMPVLPCLIVSNKGTELTSNANLQRQRLMLRNVRSRPTVANFAYHAATIDMLFRKDKHRC